MLDPRLESLLRMRPLPEWIAEEHQSIAVHAARLIETYLNTLRWSTSAETTRAARKMRPQPLLHASGDSCS